MRVRKSVPEGYKTSSHLYSPFFAQNENLNAPASIVAPVLAAPVAKTRPRAGARELTPFCGILKVGGMAQQAWDGDEGIYSDKEMEDEEEVPALSSQGSTISSFSTGTSVREKRRFLEAEEDVMVSFGDRSVGERVLAVPRRRGGKGTAKGEQNIVVVEGDFQEADFLDYGLVGEVEMSG